MIAQQHNLDVIANNLANVNTTSFKQQRAEFQDLMYQTIKVGGAQDGATTSTPDSMQIGGGSMFSADASNFEVGPPQSTGNPLDVMISGSGFFSVLRPDGTTAYTRDGSFKRDAAGLLVNSDGYQVQPEVTIPEGTTSISISNTGTVSGVRPGESAASELGSLKITNFSNPAGLQRLGQNLYLKTGASGEPTEVTPGEAGSGTLTSGYVEGSNVQVVEEMVRMITAQRAYEINSKAIQTADDMLSTMNQLKR